MRRLFLLLSIHLFFAPSLRAELPVGTPSSSLPPVYVGKADNQINLITGYPNIVLPGLAFAGLTYQGAQGPGPVTVPSGNGIRSSVLDIWLSVNGTVPTAVNFGSPYFWNIPLVATSTTGQYVPSFLGSGIVYAKVSGSNIYVYSKPDLRSYWRFSTNGYLQAFAKNDKLEYVVRNPSGGLNAGLVGSITDPNGNAYTFNYTSGHLSSISAPGAVSYTFNYDGSWDLTSYTGTSTSSTIVAFSWVGPGILSAVTDYSNATAFVFSYDAYGHANAVWGVNTSGYQNANIIDIAYGNASTPTQVVAPDSSGSYSFDSSGRLVAFANPPVTTTYAYNASNNFLLSSITTTYSPVGGSASTLLKTISYNNSGNETLETEGGITTKSWTYDTSGWFPLTFIDVINGTTTSFTYSNKLLASVKTSSSISYTYDSNGFPTGMTVNGKIFTFSFDSKKNLLSSSGPNGSATYSYTNVPGFSGTPASTIHPDGSVSVTGYAVASSGYSLNGVDYVPPGSTDSSSQNLLTFDANGLLASTSSSLGPASSLSYSASQITQYNFSGNGDSTSTVTSTNGASWSEYFTGPASSNQLILMCNAAFENNPAPPQPPTSSSSSGGTVTGGATGGTSGSTGGISN